MNKRQPPHTLASLLALVLLYLIADKRDILAEILTDDEWKAAREVHCSGRRARVSVELRERTTWQLLY